MDTRYTNDARSTVFGTRVKMFSYIYIFFGGGGATFDDESNLWYDTIYYCLYNSTTLFLYIIEFDNDNPNKGTRFKKRPII